MLREVINKHIKPRITPFQFTTAAAGATVNIGYGDFTAVRTGTGDGTLTARHGFYRNALQFYTPNAGGTVSPATLLGSYAAPGAATADNDVFDFIQRDNGGSANEASADGFVFGWDSPDLSLSKQQRVAGTQSSPRIIWGKITGATGVVAIGGNDFDCTRTAAGKYTITFKKAFGKVPTVMVTGSGNTSTSVANAPTIGGKTAAGVFVVMSTEAPAAADGDFYIMAIGCDSLSDSGRGRMPLQNSQRKPRIIGAQLTIAAGVPSIAIGGATGGADITTLVDGGAGDFSFTIAEPFIREPAIFLSARVQRAEVHSYTAGVVRIKTKAANGNDTDVSGPVYIFIIGSDDATQF